MCSCPARKSREACDIPAIEGETQADFESHGLTFPQPAKCLPESARAAAKVIVRRLHPVEADADIGETMAFNGRATAVVMSVPLVESTTRIPRSRA